ncbi:MAG: hypothetical protein IJI68_03715 [Eggerthellaceae bacterium]|nr:hypothetical protein [Eggerthellaceae bacterium]
MCRATRGTGLKTLESEGPDDASGPSQSWQRRAAGPYADDDEVSRWGAGIVWAEFHSSGPWRSDYE